MSFNKQLQMLSKYNTLLQQNNLSIRIKSWNNTIHLTSGITLDNIKEKRKFRQRVNSRYMVKYIDDIYIINKAKDRDALVKEIKKSQTSRRNKIYWNNLDEISKEQKREHVRKIQSLVDYSTKPKIVPWNKGKTKETDERILKISRQRSGSGNPMFGIRMSETEKQRKSLLIKERILTGEWTPHVHNSRTHWECVFDEKKYRSSWEALYASINPTEEYEKIRIPYIFKNKENIYIVDFVNFKTRIITEIKPQEHLQTEQMRAKVEYAKRWCRENNFKFRILTQDYFIEHYEEIPFEKLQIPNVLQKLRKIKNEASSKNKNSKTPRSV